jgi:mRNA degradation ribonuclease J1/J2
MEQFAALADAVGYENATDEIPKHFAGLITPKVHQLGVVYTHGHVDHVGWGGLISTSVPVITADASIPFFETMFLGGSGGFASEAVFRRERDTLLTNKSQRVFTPPLYLPEPYQEIRLGRGQVGVTLLPVSHSIYGGVMVKVVVYDQSDKPIKTVVYTGDFNFDNQAMMDETETHLRDVNVMITDTTNLRPNAYGKPSVGVTREIMEAGFRKVLKGTDKSSIIELAWHNLADVHLIQQIAAEMGENVYVYPKMAILLHLIHQLDETRQKNEQTYNWRDHNPVPRLGAGVLPWIYPKMTLRKGERMLQESMQVATHASLASAGQHILLTPPNPFLEHTMTGSDIQNYDNIIRAHYWPYGDHDKAIVWKNARFAKENGLVYHTDLELRGGHIYPGKKPQFHMSGHARPEDTLAMINRLAKRGVLRQVVPIHGDARQYAAQEIRKQHPDLVVYDRFGKQGHTIPLYSKA